MAATIIQSILALIFPALISLCVLLPLSAQAQVAQKPYRIGIVTGFAADTSAKRLNPLQGPFEDGLRERGWIDGKNVQLIYRSGGDENAIDELLRLPVDVLVTFGNWITQEAMRRTSTVPIVARMDLGVESGIVGSLSRPGGNVTGMSVEQAAGLATKRLALLKEVVPVKRLARLHVGPPLRFGSEKDLPPEYAAAAKALDLEILPVSVSGPEDLRKAFAELARRKITRLSVEPFARNPGSERTWDALLEMIALYRIPAMFDQPRSAQHGGMMGYGIDIPEQGRRLGYFVDRILRGARPADIPVEQPSSLSLVVNLKAAESIGVKIPATVLLQADRVIR